MIKAFIIINNYGKVRFLKFYNYMTEEQQQKVIRDLYNLTSKRTIRSSNIFAIPQSFFNEDGLKAISRVYATLNFICVIDENENELFIHSMIQSYVEVLDKCFENVCELDLVFNSDRCHYILNEFIQGGIILQTDTSEIIRLLQEQMKLEKEDAPQVKGVSVSI